jgi:hypothetical protein
MLIGLLIIGLPQQIVRTDIMKFGQLDQDRDQSFG